MMGSLRWLERLLKAVEIHYEEVKNDPILSPTTKETMLPYLRRSVDRLRAVRQRVLGSGFTPDLKNETIQALIEADVGEFLGK